MTPCTLSHYATGQDYFFFGAEFRSLRFTRTRTTFCIIVIERPRHGRVIVDTLSPCSEMMQLIGWVLARKGRILKHNLYGIEIEVPNQFFDKVSYYVAKNYCLQFGGATYESRTNPATFSILFFRMYLQVEYAWAFQVKYYISGYWDGPAAPYKQ